MNSKAKGDKISRLYSLNTIKRVTLQATYKQQRAHTQHVLKIECFKF